MLYRFALLLISALCVFSSIYGNTSSACHGSLRRTKNDIGPNFAFGLTPPPLTENVAISLLGEIGRKNCRASGTIGFFASQHRFKFTGEGISQELDFGFSSGKTDRWVEQYAVGGNYRFCFKNCVFIDSLDFYASYSQAKKRTLSPFSCTTWPQTLLFRRIAAGRDGHIAAGGVLLPWSCARLLLTVNYDRVRYDREFCDHLNISGLGGTIGFLQGLPCDLFLDFKAEFRQPYYFYGGGLTWNYITYSGKLTVGLYGSHTNGRHHLPNNSLCGLYVGYAFGGGPIFGGCYPGTPCYTDYYSFCSCVPCDSDLLTWVSRPAVAMPISMAIAEQKSVEL